MAATMTAPDASALALLQQQWEEFECMCSMFPARDELAFDALVAQEHEACVLSSGPRPRSRLQYTIHFPELSFGKEVPALEIVYPHGYPVHDSVVFTVRCPFLSREQTEVLQTQLMLLATGANGDVVVLQLYQQMLEALTDAHQERDSVLASSSRANLKAAPSALSHVLGRRAIYFHHIINPTKRRVVREWALELGLSGFSKIGWPGVVIVEGREADAQEYVRRLQRLRWKQMVVRGEQTERVDDAEQQRRGDANGSAVDALRRLPHGVFHEFPETGMSALAGACRDAGVEDLFLTTMKIYGRSEDAGTSPSLS